MATKITDDVTYENLIEPAKKHIIIYNVSPRY